MPVFGTSESVERAMSSPPAATTTTPADTMASAASSTHSCIPPLTASLEPLIGAYVERQVVPAPQVLVREVDVLAAPSTESVPRTRPTSLALVPAEIRTTIWKAMLPVPRVVQPNAYPTNFRYDGYQRTSTGFRYSRKLNKPLTIPVTLSICAESRHLTLRSYTLVGSQYIDFHRDTIWITSSAHLHFEHRFPGQDAVPWVKSLLLEVHPIRGAWWKTDRSAMLREYRSLTKKFPGLTDLSVRSWYFTECGQIDTIFLFGNPSCEYLDGGEEEQQDLPEAKLPAWERGEASLKWTVGSLEVGFFEGN